MTKRVKIVLVAGLFLALLAGEYGPLEMGPQVHSTEAAAFSRRSVEDTDASGEEGSGAGEEPDKTEEPVETEPPVETELPVLPGVTEDPAPTREPQATEEPTKEPEPTNTPASDKYALTNDGAKYKKGGLKGIHYHSVKTVKVYHLQSYTTDAVQLNMTHSSRFEVYGGKNKKEVQKKYVTVSGSGLVSCKKKAAGQVIYTLIKATSRTTGEVRYIYIHFREKLICKGGRKLSLYEKKSGTLKMNYPSSKIRFTVSDDKKAAVSAKGKVTAIKKGTVYITARVSDSVKNQVRIKVVVTKEPWIVSRKDTLYDYQDMTRDLKKLETKYNGKVTRMKIGTSYDNRTIWCLRMGKPNAERKLVIDAAIHGREWLNTQIIMRQTEDMLRNYADYKERFKETCLYIIPMDNPDGVTISQYGFDAIRNENLRRICKKAGHAKIWKANARGVNLNNNFPAGFKKGASNKPHYMAYNGKKAGSEKETKALMDFIKQVKPDAVLNLHSMGNVLYWDFDVEKELHEQLYAMAKKIRSFNSYMMMPKGRSTVGNGGFADWLVYKKNTVSVTVETGSVRCPLPHSQYKKIYKKNRDMFRWFMSEY